MNNDIFVINYCKYGSDYDVWQNDETFQSAFYTYDQYYKFWRELAESYPEGVPWEYIIQKIEQQKYYRMLESLSSLEEKKLVIRTQNEDGEDVWTLNPEML
jgi:hypothetical protein